MAFSRQTVKVEGLKEIKEALEEFSKATSGNILKRAVGTAGATFAEHAISLAPKDEGVLKKEIKVSRPKIITPGKAAFAQAMRETGDKAEAAAAARAANRSAGGDGRSAVAHVGPSKQAGQGILQEFGTAHHKAQPFMRPTWDAYDQKLVEVIRDELLVEINKAKQRAERKAARLAAKVAAGN
ncbi:HK97-gp10 family putative phage morphogenesis protein [Tardiphaga sp. 862_B3_N1_1]|uniref:HK97-gp10 family putative phage morphogenesis protein n=1 Tax=Tardiphaga sp. 862_B3_N1_1 TaxID=3240763 RepID=UPI003F89A7CF